MSEPRVVHNMLTDGSQAKPLGEVLDDLKIGPTEDGSRYDLADNQPSSASSSSAPPHAPDQQASPASGDDSAKPTSTDGGTASQAEAQGTQVVK